MTKGTPSQGKRKTKVHMRCRRCGRRGYNKQTKVCAACGYGKSKKIRKYKWMTHDLSRKRIK